MMHLRNALVLLLALTLQQSAFGQCSATITSTISASRCGTGSVTLTGHGSTGTTLVWYSSDTGSVAVGFGDTIITPILTDTTTFYVAATTGATMHGGPLSPNAGTNWGSTNLNSYQIFDVSVALQLQSVTVFPTAAGSITVALQNSSGSTLQQATFPITLSNGNYSYVPLGGGGNTTIGDGVVLPLNFSIPVGTGYRLTQLDNSSTVVRNTAGVPTSYYNVATNGLTFTGNWIGSSNSSKSYWYNFYDWVIATGDTSHCESDRRPVVAIIKPIPVVSVGGNQMLCANSNLTLGVGNTLINNYTWSTGATTNTINATSTGTYWVLATNAASGCTASDTATVTPSAVPSVASITAAVGTNSYVLSAVDAQNATSYLWTFGDGTTSTDVQPQHIYESAGSFTVHLCVSNECYTTCEGMTATANTQYVQGVLNVTVTDVEEIALADMGIKLFPTPTNNILYVQANQNVAIQQLAIYNALGQQVYNIAVNGNNTSVSTQTLANGIYVVSLQTDKGTITQRISVTH